MMNSARRHVARSILTLSTLALCFAAPARPAATAPALPAGGSDLQQPEVAGIRPEGRLRKLHLVRPDLIPYPIAYEVYC